MSLANVLEVEITLFKDLEVYFIDEVVEGFVVFTAYTNVEINFMGIDFFGEAKVCWDDSTYCSEPSTITIYRSSEEYHKEYKTVIHNNRIIPANIYRYDFKFRLTENCLTSFESKYGKIRYEINFRINRVPLEELVYKRAVTVLNPNDANTNPLYKVPKQVIGNTTTCCGIISSRRIFLTMRTQFGVYAPGQRLTYYLELNNKSKKEVLSYKIKFYRIVKFHAKSPFDDERQIVKKLYSRIRFASSARHHIIYDGFIVPPTPPTLSSSEIMSVKYMLKARARISCSILSTLKLKMEVIIAMAPVRDSVPTKRVVRAQSTVATKTAIAAQPTTNVETPTSVEVQGVAKKQAAVEMQPIVGTPPDTEVLPLVKNLWFVATQSGSGNQPVVETHAVVATPPLHETQPIAETQLHVENLAPAAVQPISETHTLVALPPVIEVQPVPEIQAVVETHAGGAIIIETQPFIKTQPVIEMQPVTATKLVFETQAQAKTQQDIESEPDAESHPVLPEIPSQDDLNALDSLMGELVVKSTSMQEKPKQTRPAFLSLNPIVKVIQHQPESPDIQEAPSLPGAPDIKSAFVRTPANPNVNIIRGQPDSPDIQEAPSLPGALDIKSAFVRASANPTENVIRPQQNLPKIQEVPSLTGTPDIKLALARASVNPVLSVIRQQADSPDIHAAKTQDMEPDIIVENLDSPKEETQVEKKGKTFPDIKILEHLRTLEVIDEEEKRQNEEEEKITPHGYQWQTRADSPFRDVEEGNRDYLYGFQPLYPIYRYED